MTYKVLDTLDKILIPTAIIVLTVFLLSVVVLGFDKYSYNEGFYDGLSSFCDGEQVIIVTDASTEEKKFRCLKDYQKEINEKYSIKPLPNDFDFNNLSFVEVKTK